MKNEMSGNPWNYFAETRDCLYTAGAHRPGFHGDINLINLVESILPKCYAFIETGTYHGCTAYYVSANFHRKVYTCDPSEEANIISRENLKKFGNEVVQFNSDSLSMLRSIIETDKNIIQEFCLFWLDGHGDDRNSGPLLDELDFIFSNFKNCCVIIDDVVVPGTKSFVLGDQFDFDWFKSKIPESYSVQFPTDYEKSGYAHVGYAVVSNSKDRIEQPFLREENCD